MRKIFPEGQSDSIPPETVPKRTNGTPALSEFDRAVSGRLTPPFGDYLTRHSSSSLYVSSLSRSSLHMLCLFLIELYGPSIFIQ